jgi:hypothetical protein
VTETMTAATGHPGLTGRPIYLDYNATTPVGPRVVDAALPNLTTHFGNPSSAQAIVCEAEIQKGRAYGSPARSKDTTHSGASSRSTTRSTTHCRTARAVMPFRDWHPGRAA